MKVKEVTIVKVRRHSVSVKSKEKIIISIDDDSIVDLSPAAALLPAEQRQNGQTNIQQQEQQQHAQVGHTESHLSAGSIGSSTSIIQQQQHINQPPSPSAHHQQQNYVHAKLSIDIEEAMVFLLELIVSKSCCK
jgi:hypothetical protein